MPAHKIQRRPESWEKAWENRKLVYAVINRLSRRMKVPFRDHDLIFSAGLEALCASYENYRPEKNNSFKRYASQNISRLIFKAINDDSTIRVSSDIRRLAISCAAGKKDLATIPDTLQKRKGVRAAVADAMRTIKINPLYSPGDFEPSQDKPPHVPCEVLRQAIDILPPSQRRSIDYLYPLTEDETVTTTTKRERADAMHHARIGLNRMRAYLESQGYRDN